MVISLTLINDLIYCVLIALKGLFKCVLIEIFAWLGVIVLALKRF